MKHILAFVMTLSLSLQGFAAGLQREPASYRLQQGTFSSLILTSEQFANLSPDDRTVYLMSLISLTQVLEISQSKVMGKAGVPKKRVEVTPSSSHSYVWYDLFVGKAQAIVRLALTALAKVASKTGGLTSAVGRYFESSGLKMAENVAVREATAATKVASKAAKEAEAVSARNAGVVAGRASETALLKAAKEETVASVKSYVKAQDAFNKVAKSAGPTSTQYKAAQKAFDEAGEKMVAKTNKLFNLAPGQKTQLKAEVDEMLVKAGMTKFQRVMKFSKDHPVLSMIGGMAAYDQGKTSVQNLSTEQFMDLVEKASQATGLGAGFLTQHKAKTEAPAAAGAQTAAAPTEESPAPAAATDAPAGKSSKKGKAEGLGCLFGGRASNWENQGGSIVCTVPSNTYCGDGYFQCEDYGIEQDGKSIAEKMCIDYDPLSDLTFRCSKALKEIINAKKSAVNESEYGKVAEELKEVVAALESSDAMTTESGETISILDYCKAGPEAQKEECKAIMSILEAIPKGAQKEIATTAQTQATVKAANKESGVTAKPSEYEDPAGAPAKSAPKTKEEKPDYESAVTK